MIENISLINMDNLNITSSLCDVFHQDLETEFLTPSKYYDNNMFHGLVESQDIGNKLTIFNTNARSLLRHKSEYDLLLDSLSKTKNFQFDILTFCETWLDDDLENLVQFENYSGLFRHKFGRKEGGGLALYVKNNLKFKIRHDLLFPEQFRSSFDCMFVEILANKDNMHNQVKNTILGVIYRSPSQQSIPELTESLQKLLQNIAKEDKNIILTGDLNIDLLQHNSSNITTDFLDMLISHNLIPKVTLPTRVTHSTATLIDHVFSNIDPEKAIVGTLTTDITDHFSNFIFTDIAPKASSKPKYISYRKVNNQTIQKFNHALEKESWQDVFNSNNPDVAYNNFLTTYNALMNKHLPVITVKFNKFKHKLEPWITTGLLKSSKTKEKLYISMIKAKNTNDFPVYERNYKKYALLFKSLIKSAKNIYWANKFELTKSDMKQTWNCIKIILNKTYNKLDFPSVFLHNSTNITNPLDIANGFNKYFVNVGNELASKVSHFPGSAANLLPLRNLPHSFLINPTTHHEISKIIENFKPKTSSGYDQISPKLLKKSCKSISHPLTFIANLSFETGIFPSAMKIAKVIPIFKKDDNKIFSNYRPISLLPTFSKILERVVHKRLYHYLVTHNLLSQSQYGFQANISTEHAILELQNRIVTDLARKHWCSGIFIDLSKAFDSLNHEILLNKLNHLGVRGKSLTWFKSYLSERCQYVEINCSKSNNLNITCGVPQGSILGPLLFLVYINDLSDNIGDSNCILFADDTTILFSEENFNDLEHKMSENLKVIYKWLCLNKLSLNIGKTNYVIFHCPQRKLPHKPSVKIADKEIEMVNDTKFLGVYIDNHLNWKKHCKVTATKCGRVASILYRLKHSLEPKILTTIYHSLFLPHLLYGLTAWGNCISSELKRIRVLQKKVIRTITKSKYNSHTDPICKKLKILKMDELFKIKCCKLYFNVKSGITKPYFIQSLLPTGEIHNYNTRQNHDIHQVRITKSIETQSINSKVSSTWNELPDYLKNHRFNSFHTFSKAVKKYYISKYFTTCQNTNCYICENS